MERRARIAWRLAGWSLVIALVPLAVLGWITHDAYRASLTKAAIEALGRIASERALEVEQRLWERRRAAEAIARLPGVAMLLPLLDPEREGANGHSAKAHAASRAIEERLAAVVDGSATHDVFLVSPGGDVVFTVAHEADLHTNLWTGPWRDTPLARAVLQAQAEVRTVTSEFAFYEPSGKLAGFVAAPIVRDASIVGIAAIQLNWNGIGEVIDRSEGDGDGLVSHLASFQDGTLISAAPIDGARGSRPMGARPPSMKAPLLRAPPGERADRGWCTTPAASASSQPGVRCRRSAGASPSR